MNYEKKTKHQNINKQIKEKDYFKDYIYIVSMCVDTDVFLKDIYKCKTFKDAEIMTDDLNYQNTNRSIEFTYSNERVNNIKCRE